MCLLQIFSPNLCLSSHSLDKVFHRAQVFLVSPVYRLLLLGIKPSVLYLKRYCYIQGHLSFLLCYLLGVVYFILRFTMHFELIFVKSVQCLDSFFCMWMSNCSGIICWKELSLLHSTAFAPLSKISWLLMWTYISALCPVPSICLFSYQHQLS